MKVNATVGKGTFRIVEFKNPSGVIVHRVTGWSPDRVRVRENYQTHGEAVTRMRELEIQAVNLTDTARPVVTRLSAEQAVIAERAFAQLAGKSMLEAVDYYLANYREPLHQIKLSDAVSKFIADKEQMNLRPDTLRNLRGRLDLFKRQCGDKPLAQITADDCRDFVNRPRIMPKTGSAVAAKPRSKVNARLVLSNFFSWAGEHKFVQTSPLLTVKASVTERDEPVILALPEIRKLLTAAADYKHGRLLPYVVLATFAAIRPTELSRIGWDDIRLDGKASVTVTGKAAKLRARRVVDLAPNAAEWLQPFSLARAPIVPDNFRRDFDAVRELAGFDVAKWVPDVLRHVGVTMHLTKWEHEGRTALWAGNSPDIVQRHYRGLVSKADATSFWKIAPDPVKAVKKKEAA